MVAVGILDASENMGLEFLDKYTLLLGQYILYGLSHEEESRSRRRLVASGMNWTTYLLYNTTTIHLQRQREDVGLHRCSQYSFLHLGAMFE